MKHPLLKKSLLDDGYEYRSYLYLSEYTRRREGYPALTMEQRKNGYEKKQKEIKWTKEYRLAYMREYNKKNYHKYFYSKKTKRLTMDEMLDKIKRMREEQNIIL